jgi:hypothetical protein
LLLHPVDLVANREWPASPSGGCLVIRLVIFFFVLFTAFGANAQSAADARKIKNIANNSMKPDVEESENLAWRTDLATIFLLA